MTNERVEAITSGIDWLSMTLTEDKSNYAQWRQDAHLALYRIAQEGYEIKQRALLGYVGVSVGNCFVGHKEGETLAQFTGHHADVVYDELMHPDAHYSRIDLQITVKYEEMPTMLGRKEYKRAKRYNDSLPKHKRRRIDFFIGGNGGDTCYIGAPSSDQRGRIYNKEIQSEDVEFVRTWRYEAMLRNDICATWLNASYPSDMPKEYRVLAFVTRWFSERGVDISSLSDHTVDFGAIRKTQPSDAERKLLWLAIQVVPTVNWLADMGYEYDLRELFYRITNDRHYPSCSLADAPRTLA